MTASADMQRLLDDIAVKYPGVLKSDIQAKLFVVANEFLEWTNLWYEDIDITLSPGVLSYSVAPAEVPPGRLARLLVLYNSQDPRLPELYWCDRARFTLPGTVEIATRPSTVATWVARFSKIIATTDADGNPEMPDWIMQRYRDCFVAGIQREFCLEQSKPWTSAQMSGYWGKLFLQYKSSARVDAIRGNVLGQTNWAYPQSFGRGTQKGV